MNFDELTKFLEKRLHMPLPGDAAHQRMMPKMSNGKSYRLKQASPPKKGGVLILLYENNGTICFPLIQRASYQGIHSGQMALPGGKYEPTDENQIKTALREAEEEIGVKREKVKVIGSLSEFFVAVSNYMVLPVIGVLDHKPELIPEAREVQDIITPSVSVLIDPNKLKEKEMKVRGEIPMNCPYFDLEGRTVWGATAMMLSELVVILQEYENR